MHPVSLAATDDTTALQRWVHQRDEQAFQLMVKRYLNLVYGVAYRKLERADWAEEVTQNVFVILAQKAHRIDGTGGIAGWLQKTAQLESLQRLRTERRRETRLKQYEHMHRSAHPEADVEPSWQSLRPALDDALADLSETDRQVLLWHHYEQQSFVEVARQLGVSHDAARKRGLRALERLSRLLQRRGVSVSATGLGIQLTANLCDAAPAHLSASVSAVSTARTGHADSSWMASKPILAATFVAITLPIAFELAPARHPEVTPLRAQPTTLRSQPSKLPDDPMLRDLALSLQGPMDSERLLEQVVFISTLSLDQLEPAWKLVELTKFSPERLVEAVSTRWAELDLADAIRKAESLPDPSKFLAYAWQGVANIWGSRDPAGLWQKIATFAEADAKSWQQAAQGKGSAWPWTLVAQTIARLAVDHLPQAMTLVEFLPTGSARDELRATALTHAAFVAPVASGQWMKTHLDPVLCESLVQKIARELATRSPSAAWQLLPFIEHPESRTEAAASILPTLYTTDPTAALQALIAWPEEWMAKNVGRELGLFLGSKSLAEIELVLGSVPSQSYRSELIHGGTEFATGTAQAAASDPALSDREFLKAATWVDRLTDPLEYQRAVGLLYDFWKNKQEPSARAWLQQLPRLSAEARHAFLQ